MQKKTGRRNLRRSRRQKQKRKIVTILVLVIVAILLLAGGFLWSKLSKMDKVTIGKKDVKTNDLSEETKKGMEGYTTLALFGLDNRTLGSFEAGNSDTMIVVSINNKTSEIKMASVYRDTYLDIGDNKFRKANAAYNNGGPKQAINMLNKNLDLSISDYVSVDFLALVKVVDMLDGIELEINDVEAESMIGFIDEVAGMTGNSSSYVSAGTQTVDGVQATAYARVRQTTGWDFKRTERQRIVIAKIFEKAKKTDLLTLNKILDTVLPDISTSLSAAELLGLAKDATKYEMGESTGFPYEKVSEKFEDQGETVFAIDLEANVVQLHEFLYANESYTPSETVKEISATIRNNTGH